MPDKVSNAMVFYDGSCPLCASEIRHYRNQDSNHELAFVDVSKEDALLPVNLTRQQAMARFHILSRDGRLLAGASAFAEVWANLPKWRWAARAATLPGAMPMLDVAYSISLRVRPAVSRLFGRFHNSKLRRRTGLT